MTLDIKIEIKSKSDPYYGWHDAIMTFFEHMNPQRFNFKDCDFRINDVEFTSRTEEFVKTIEQHVIWTKLNDRA